MTLSRANASGWASKDKLTSTQVNHMDTEIVKAPDFVNGGSYTLASTVDMAGNPIRLMGSLRLKYQSRTIARTLKTVPYIPNAATNYRLPNASEIAAGYPEWTLINLSNATPNPRWAIGLPNGGVIDTIKVYYKGAAGHAAFPGGAPTMPSFKLSYYTYGSLAVPTVVATGTDTSSSAGAYEGYHAIAATSISHTVDNTSRRYVIEVVAETGANYITAGAFFGADITIAVSDQSEFD